MLDKINYPTPVYQLCRQAFQVRETLITNISGQRLHCNISNVLLLNWQFLIWGFLILEHVWHPWTFLEWVVGLDMARLEVIYWQIEATPVTISCVLYTHGIVRFEIKNLCIFVCSENTVWLLHSGLFGWRFTFDTSSGKNTAVNIGKIQGVFFHWASP